MKYIKKNKKKEIDYLYRQGPKNMHGEKEKRWRKKKWKGRDRRMSDKKNLWEEIFFLKKKKKNERKMWHLVLGKPKKNYNLNVEVGIDYHACL